MISFQINGVLAHIGHQYCSFRLSMPTIWASILRAPDP